MAITGLHYLPWALFLIIPVTFFGTYLAAVAQGHVPAEVPYISDTGTYPPESCVFGQLVDIASVGLCVLVYVRYCEICQYCEEYPTHPRVQKLNKTSLILGLLAAFGFSIVGNFQETNVRHVHYAGALLCFGCGTIYFWMMALCSYHLYPIANSIILAHFRVALAMICTVFFFIVLIAGIASQVRFHGTNPRKWRPEDGGFALHVISTVSEWIVALCFCLYLLTFSSEFSRITFTHPQVLLKPRVNSTLGERDPILT